MKPCPTALLIALACAAPAVCANEASPSPAAPIRADAPAAARPNILFILVDDLGYGDLGCLHQNARAAAGKPAIKTPNLDAFAREGVRLTQHYCPAPVCAPSRASLLSGVTQGHANVRDNQFDKALEDNHTLASVMKEAGYATCAIGKWGLQGESKNGGLANCPAHPLNRGFDDFFGYLRHADGHEHYPKENPLRSSSAHKGRVMLFDGRREITDQLDKCYTADLFAAKAKDWIIRHQKEKPEQPFFMYLAFDTPHAVLEVPTEAYPPGGGLGGGLRWIGTPGHMISTAEGRIDSFIHPDCRGADWPMVDRRYATCVRRLDDAVGDLAQLLKDLKLDENTLVVFTSDNGPSIESYLPQPVTPEFFASFGPFDGIKRDCWEGGIRVPTLARWPGHVKADMELKRPSSFPDWMPTCAALAGWPAPARTDGTSLLSDLTGEGKPPPQKPVYVEYFEGGKTPKFKDFAANHRGRARKQMQMIRLNGKIGVRYDIKSADDDFEIYDAVEDPGQRNNLASGGREAQLERTMKDAVLQLRRPNPSAPRPYDGAPVPALAPREGLAAGLHFEVFANPAPWVPDTDGLVPLRRGEAQLPDLAPAKPAAHEAVAFSGFLKVPADGDYTFTLSGTGRAFLRLHDAALVDADRGRLAESPAGMIRLKAGLHPLRLTYAPTDAAGRAVAAMALKLEWSGPGLARQPVPADALAR